MNGRPLDPRDPDTRPVELDPVVRELERYAELTEGEVPDGLADRVMAAVAEEQAPRRGWLVSLLGTFGTFGTGGGAPRLLLVGATMALAVLAVVLAGRLAELFPDQQIGPSPSPSVIELPTLSPSPSPTPSQEPSSTPRPTRSPRPSPSASPSDDDEPETPEPDETAEPSDDDNSGPGGGGDGDDNSGPGGGGDDDDGGGSGPG